MEGGTEDNARIGGNRDPQRKVRGGGGRQHADKSKQKKAGWDGKEKVEKGSAVRGKVK